MDLPTLSDAEAEGGRRLPGPPRGGGPSQSPGPRTRSLSDGGAGGVGVGAGTPRLSPAPHIIEASRHQSKDDIAIRDCDCDRDRDRGCGSDRDHHEHSVSSLPSTPVRAGFPLRGQQLHLRQPAGVLDTAPASSASQPAGAHVRTAAPLSPKLEHIYASPSPTNFLPRRSRGLDFSRAATSLHHSTLADQASPDSSPTIGSRAMNIPGARAADYGGPEQSSTSLWSMMGDQERMQISSSLGSTSQAILDSSSSSDDDIMMDEDMDDAYVTTPSLQKLGMPAAMGTPWMPASPAVINLPSFQQRQRQRQRKPPRKRVRGPLGLGFQSPAAPGITSRSPPNSFLAANDMSPHARRESISWAANQLHISGNESDDNHSRQLDGVESPLRPSIVRRAVTRRGNLLPKTKGFARIRAALAEESAPIEAEFRREAEVVRQVRESDRNFEHRQPPPHSVASTALSSPNLATHDSMDEMVDDMMVIDPSTSALGLAGSFKQHAMKNSKGRAFWDTFSDTSSTGGGTQRVTPPPPPAGLARASSTGLSLEDVNMDSPSASSNGGASQTNPFALPGGGTQTATASSSGSGSGTPLGAATTTTQPPAPSLTAHTTTPLSTSREAAAATTPSLAEVSRRVSILKRCRAADDDLDPISIKRRAVSPGMSVHNSPVMQSPLQRDAAPWGPASNSGSNSGSGSSSSAGGGLASRPGSVGGDSTSGVPAGIRGGGSGSLSSGAASESGSVYGGGGGRAGAPGAGAGAGGKGRVGFQGMAETNDGITRLSIE